MGKINLGRVIAGGILAGVIIDVVETVVSGKLLAGEWADFMAKYMPSVGTNEIIFFNIYGLVLGLVAVWAYAAIRPRFGAGVKTAVYAGLLVWTTAYLLASLTPLFTGMFTARLFAIAVCVGLVEIVVATIAGAWIYKEADTA